MNVLRARTLGMLLQGLVIGGFLFVAVCEILMLAAGARIFRYQDF